MQNTMLEGEVWSLGKKMKNEQLGKKDLKKGKETGGKLHEKRGKGLKMDLFGVINFKNFSRWTWSRGEEAEKDVDGATG